jgi:hypothetical protein
VDGIAGVHMPKTPEGRPLGEAYVEFASEAELQEALQRDRNKVGPRYIELFVSSKAEMHQVRPPPLRACGLHWSPGLRRAPNRRPAALRCPPVQRQRGGARAAAGSSFTACTGRPECSGRLCTVCGARSEVLALPRAQGPPPRRRRQLQDNGYGGMGGGRGRGGGGRAPPPQYVGGSITGGVALAPGSGCGAGAGVATQAPILRAGRRSRCGRGPANSDLASDPCTRAALDLSPLRCARATTPQGSL